MINRSTPRPPVLKADDAFAIFSNSGNLSSGAEGVFRDDTRHLSRLEWTLDGAAPQLLSSAIAEENSRLSADLANPDLAAGEASQLAPHSVHIRNSLVLGGDALFQTLEITNFAGTDCRFRLEAVLAADFIDLFELRGVSRSRHGAQLPARIEPGRLTLAYRGLDGVERRTALSFDPPPDRLDSERAGWEVALPPNGRLKISLAAAFERSDREPAAASLETTLATAKLRHRERADNATRCTTDNDIFNEWLARSRGDLDMLITDTPDGPYPYAGIPWFATAFGRDGLITALECLWVDPAIAAGVLRFLAARQATALDAASDAEPGKILHETRHGEMAALKEIPYGRYYGSVDATPLFVILADAYHARTGDLGLIGKLWPAIAAAIAWMEKYGDADGDGFIEYGRKSDQGLANQGWKDSGDAIFHRDGRIAEAPIALVEVQAYGYAAYCGAARLAALLGRAREHDAFAAAASRLQQRFEAAFWSEELGLYGLALDRDKQRCDVLASNAGHALFGGIASEAHARRVAERLLRPDFFSGWGIRTLARGERRYNPMSYHNGSIWPHDLAMTAMGLARYGIKPPIVTLMTSLFGAASAMPMRRLPELFCGFERERDMAPVTYPTACSPQAWSSAAVFAMLGAALGISLDAPSHQVRLRTPALPPWLPTVEIANLRLGDAAVDLRFERHDHGVAVEVCGHRGEIEIIETR